MHVVSTPGTSWCCCAPPMAQAVRSCPCERCQLELGEASAACCCLSKDLRGKIPLMLGLNRCVSWDTKAASPCSAGELKWEPDTGHQVSLGEMGSCVIMSPGAYPAWWTCPSPFIAAWTTVFWLVTVLQDLCFFMKPFFQIQDIEPPHFALAPLLLAGMSCVTWNNLKSHQAVSVEGLLRHLVKHDNICRAWFPQTFIVSPQHVCFWRTLRWKEVPWGQCCSGEMAGWTATAAGMAVCTHVNMGWKNLLHEHKRLKMHNK